jgi:hypothetical protein
VPRSERSLCPSFSLREAEASLLLSFQTSSLAPTKYQALHAAARDVYATRNTANWISVCVSAMQCQLLIIDI